jgi:hypothetical protein
MLNLPDQNCLPEEYSNAENIHPNIPAPEKALTFRSLKRKASTFAELRKNIR